MQVSPLLKPTAWQGLRTFRKDPLKRMTEAARESDGIGAIPVGPFTFYVLAEPEYVYEVLVGQADIFYRTTLAKRILGSGGDGLLSSDGEFHRRQRRLAQPAFHHKRIESYAHVMVEFTEQMLIRWQPGQVIPVHEEMMKLTLSIVSKTLFDANVADIAASLQRPISDTIQIINDKFTSLFNPPLWVPTPRNRRERRANDALVAVVNRFIDEHRTSGDHGDLLSMLMMSNDNGEKMDDSQLFIESLTMFLAGHETTAVLMMWTWYLLSQHPQIEAKLHTELDSALGGRLPTVNDLANLPYTAMIIKEVLRLYPPAWLLSREPIQETTLGNHVVKQGSMLMLSPYVIHRDPRFFSEPDRFIPERWGNGAEKRLPRFAYFPFGGGPHVCIGQGFATMEASLILASIAQRFRLELVPEQRIEMLPLVTLRPRYGIYMQAQPRPTQ